ncbi:Proto-oncogene tyrosine-protein kinase receptor Ret [Dirofilaria immitis]
MLLLLSAIDFLLFSTSTSLRNRNGNGCNDRCDHYANNIAYENCINKCSSEQFTTNTFATRRYPSPPFNISVDTTAIIGDVKFLESTVSWDFEPDSERIGFYLRVTALEEWCERDFPGYYTYDIGPMEQFHTIPAMTTDSQPLEIQHDCTYLIHMHSKPYPYGDPNFATGIKYMVPTCIEGYCSCANQNSVPVARNVSIKTYQKDGKIKATVNWMYPAISGHTHQFRFDLSERFYHNHINFGNPNAFKFRIADMPSHVVYAKENVTSLSTVLPIDLAPNEEYRLTVFAMNDQLCHSDDVTISFFTGLILTDDDMATLPAGIENHTEDFYQKELYNITDMDGFDKKPPIREVSDKSFYSPIIILATTFALVTTVSMACCLAYFLVRKFYKNGKSQIEKSSVIPWAMAHSSHSMLETNILYRQTTNLASQIDYEIPFNQIQVGGIIGQGAFGTVCMGTAYGVEGYIGPTTVAVKQLKANADENERREFLAEMDIMKQVGRHPNIVAMYGCCTEPNHQCMIMEYVPFGDLKHYLQNLRKQFDRAMINMKSSFYGRDAPISPSLPPSMHSSFLSNLEDNSPHNEAYHMDPIELQSFAIQVANGMAHIESLGIVHRDLAARNILVGRGNQLKISDFGLSRHGVYVKTSKGVIPLRWLSVEAIQRNIYSTKSDVWAYGVVLWEICTLGGFPYPTVSDKDLLKYLLQGNRLEKPVSSSNEVYDVMIQCWSHNANDRPSFAYLCEHLNDLSNQQCPYVEFIPGEALPPPDGYCELIGRPMTHADLSTIDDLGTTEVIGEN